MQVYADSVSEPDTPPADPRRLKRAAADQPARSAKDDLLGRTRFAAAIADALVGWREPESLVVALTGPWGAGKSSVTNFVIESLRAHHEAERPDILQFNPWLVAGQGDVANKLLREIGIALKSGDTSANDADLARKWEEWAAALSLGSAVYEAFPLGTSALVISGLAAIGVTALVPASHLDTVFSVLGAIALTIGLVVKLSATIAEKARDLFRARTARNERTLDERKQVLRKAMEDRKRQLVVVIDDIDRLPASEVQLLLRAVRANADFPNLAFLLVFEREVVEKAISDQAHVNGAEYLQKIIQVPFSLPTIDPPRLQKVLFTALDELLDALPATVPFDKRRWGNLYMSGLRTYFRTLRDVYRYTTTLEFHLGMLRTGSVIEVNQIDLLALEALRVFEPRLYDALPAHRSLLLEGPGRPSGYGADPKSAAQAKFDALLALANPDTREAARSVLASVFQPIEWLTQNSGFGYGFEDGWARALRACSESYFDRYFLLSVPSGAISEADVQAILAIAGDRHALVAKFKDLASRDLLEAMLEHLESYKETLPMEHAVPFTTAVFDVGDGLADRSGAFGIGASMHASRIVFWYLKRFDTIEEREAALLAAVTDTTGLEIAADVVSMESRSGERKRDYLVREERLPEFHAAVAAKIAAAGSSGALLRHTDLGSLLYRWQAWGPPGEAEAWVAAEIQRPEGALGIIRAFAGNVRSQGIGDYVATVRKVVRLKDVEAFVPPEDVAVAVLNIDRSTLSTDDAEALAAFAQALDRRRAGKPDLGPLDLPDDDS